MFQNTSPFEFDKESMIQRNKDMYKHFSKLNFIKNRKNTYLPKINIHNVSPNKSKTKSKSKSKNKVKNKIINKNKTHKNFPLLFIEKDNEILNNRINEIYMRPKKKAFNEKILKNLLKLRKHIRENTRKSNLDLLLKTNNEMKNRIKNVHPVINHKDLKMQYLESRKLYDLKRQLKPCLSWGNTFFTKEDYSYMEKYRNILSDRNKSLNNTSSSKDIKDIIKLNKIKSKKLGFSMSLTKTKIK